MFRHLAAGTGALWLGLAAPGAHAACQLAAITDIPIEGHGGRILIPSEINGQKALFILDTGASRSMIFADAAQRFGLHYTNVSAGQIGMEMYGVGGRVDLGYTQIARLKLGGLTMANAGVLVSGVKGDGGVVAG